MAQLDADQYLRLTPEHQYGRSDGLYWDTTNSLLVLVINDAIVFSINSSGTVLAGAIEAADLEISGETRGDLLYRAASDWARLAVGSTGKILNSDGTDPSWAAISGDATMAAGGALTVTDVTVGSDATGDLLYKSSATALARLAAGSAGKQLRMNAGATAPTWADDCTSIDFTTEREVPIFAKTTGAIKTAANAQQDFLWVGGNRYLELAQGVGALGANTLLAANGLTPSPTGWLLTLDDTATDSLELTEGIVLGSARSFVAGTSAAFHMRCAFLVTTRANITHLSMGFRELGAYATASTYAEMKTAYPEKAFIGIADNAGALRTDTSKANADVSTALAAAAAANGDILALQVLVSGAGAVTYKLARATPAGSTAAQTQAAVTTAFAALATDANAVAMSFTAAAVVVPSIIIGASGAGAPDVKLVNYFCGNQ